MGDFPGLGGFAQFYLDVFWAISDSGKGVEEVQGKIYSCLVNPGKSIPGQGMDLMAGSSGCSAWSFTLALAIERECEGGILDRSLWVLQQELACQGDVVLCPPGVNVKRVKMA